MTLTPIGVSQAGEVVLKRGKRVFTTRCAPHTHTHTTHAT